MKQFLSGYKRLLLSAILIGAVCFSCGCARVKVHTANLPPILTQSEVLRPYDKVADIQVRRERQGVPTDLTPEDYSWAYDALRSEAARIGADAVILPEVTVEMESYILFPSSEIKAKGVAIKFH